MLSLGCEIMVISIFKILTLKCFSLWEVLFVLKGNILFKKSCLWVDLNSKSASATIV